MNQEQQRIAIAEWMGWRLETSNVHDGNCWHLNGIQSEDAPPIYHEDLNAMHEAEKKLTIDQAWAYNRRLQDQLGVSGGKGSGAIDEWQFHATASQRSEALCRTLWPVRFEMNMGRRGSDRPTSEPKL